MNRFSILIAALLVCSFPVLAQNNLPDASAKKNALKLVPQQFIAKTFQLDWEHSLSPKASLQFSPSVTAGSSILDNNYEEITGGGMEVTGKIYVGNRSIPLEGFYAGLSGSYHKYKMKQPEFIQVDPIGNPIWNNGYTVHVSRYTTNVTFGYQFIIQDIVAIDLYAGGGMRIGDSDEPNFNRDRFSQPGIFNFAYTGVAPKVGFSIGILF